ncbi:uncharacterized protein cubi_00677 [Cryptosporidium ubiquitum]|uniref:Uncharacterized protein n=1 Tax=Cryptosporidium ubiquitum TaxID=857276 RepID=A0A1J4MG77_9CRYT|nr:uncharacterized protein cubi_00677 [Cryptosporidium ubiquitum]OII71869.1 hypothetical protein cubi_00677 [Cryptosporidium ubiquitum]
MVKALALELLEFLYNELMKRPEEGVYSGEVLEQHACSVLANLHASKDPFGIYRQELVSQDDRTRRSNNPLSHVIRRLNEEIFAITTTFSYPILLTPKLYIICISLLSELSLGRLSPLFLETYDGHVDKFEKVFRPLMLELFIRKAPWWILAKNIKYLIENISSGVVAFMCDNKISAEFQELNTVLGLEVRNLELLNFLPLFFTSFESLKKGILEGRYSFNLNLVKEKNRINTKRTSNLVNLGAIIDSSKIVESLITSKKNEKATPAEKENRVLDTFALTRVSIAAFFRFLSKFGIESGKKEFAKFELDFNYVINAFEVAAATLLSGTEMFNLSVKEGNSQELDVEYKPNQRSISQEIFELDGSKSNDIFTLVNKANKYLPFHFLHIQIVSGLRNLLINLNKLKGSNQVFGNFSGLNDLIIAYIMRMLNQIEKIIEVQNLKSIIEDQENSKFSNSKFNRYLELIPSETIFLIEEMTNYYEPCKSVFKKKLLDVHISQLKNSKKKVSSFFMITFTQVLKDGISNNLDYDLLTESWDRIFGEIVFPSLLDTYTIDLFISMISNTDILNSLSRINMESFLGKYLGVFTRILAYHPDLSAKYIITFIMNCIKNLKDQMPNFQWLSSWTKIVLSVICMPLMTFFPQKVNCDVNDFKVAIGSIKPNNKIFKYLSILVYPKIYAENRKKGKTDLMQIISDFSTNLLLVSIYNSNYTGNKRIHTTAVLNVCNKMLDLLINDLIDSLEDYKSCIENKCLNFDEPVISIEKSNIAKLISALIKVFPYLFHQGAKYSQEIYENIVKIITFIITKFNELLFHNEVFEVVLNLLNFDFHSNIISPICWIIGEVFISQINNNLLDEHEKKILRLIDSLKLLIEGCSLKCTEVYNELNKRNSNLKAETESNNGVNDEANSECSNSSYSSFLSDSSVEIDHVVSEDELKESVDHFISTSNGFTGEEISTGYGGYFENNKYNSENMCKTVAEFLEEDDMKDVNKYLDNIYLVEAIISTLCKIGLSCKQSKSNITILLEMYLNKFQIGSSEKDNFENENLLCQEDQLIQYSRFIVSNKINLCIKSLNQSSVFSTALNKPTEPLSMLFCNRSLSSILF